MLLTKRQPTSVMQQTSVVVSRAKVNTKVRVTLHVPVNQWQFQSQFTPCMVAYVDLAKWKLVLSKLANLWVCHVPAACQVVLAYKRLVKKVLQGMKAMKNKMVKKATKLPSPVWNKKVKYLLLAKLVKVSVKEAVWRNHVCVHTRMPLVPCWPHQVCKWVVQNCLCWRKWKLVQPVAKVACKQPWPVSKWRRRQ